MKPIRVLGVGFRPQTLDPLAAKISRLNRLAAWAALRALFREDHIVLVKDFAGLGLQGLGFLLIFKVVRGQASPPPPPPKKNYAPSLVCTS